MSKQYRRLPSEIYKINDDVAAYYFDRAIYVWGNFADNYLDEASSKAKTPFQVKFRRQNAFRTLMGWNDKPGQFRDPAKNK